MPAPAVKFKRMASGHGLPLPSRGSSDAAGIDLCAAVDGLIWREAISAIPTGFAVEIPQGYVGLIRSRSGLAFKSGVVAFHGTIDADFRGELVVGLTGGHSTVKRGERIAQLVIVPVAMFEIVEADELSETVRGDKGFGSTGL
jgi:dUTP pyrophosphatase